MIDNREYRGHYLNVERTAEQRRKDLVVAFDEIYELKRKMGNLKLMLWIMGLLLSAVGAIALMLLQIVLERI